MQSSILPIDCFKIIFPMLEWKEMGNVACSCNELKNEITKVAQKRFINEVNSSETELKSIFPDYHLNYGLKFIRIVSFLTRSKCLSSENDCRKLLIKKFTTLCKEKKFEEALEIANFARHHFNKDAYMTMIAHRDDSKNYGLKEYLEKINVWNTLESSNHYFELALIAINCDKKDNISMYKTYSKILNKIKYFEIPEKSVEIRLNNLKTLNNYLNTDRNNIQALYSDLYEIYSEKNLPNIEKIIVQSLYKNSIIKIIEERFITREFSGLPELLENLCGFDMQIGYLEKICKHFSHAYELSEFIAKLRSPKLISFCSEKLCKIYIDTNQSDLAIANLSKIREPSKIAFFVEKIANLYLADKNYEKASKLIKEFENKLKNEETFINIKYKINTFDEAIILSLNPSTQTQDQIRILTTKKLLCHKVISLAFDCANKIYDSVSRDNCFEDLFTSLSQLSRDEINQHLELLKAMDGEEDYRREYLRDIGI